MHATGALGVVDGQFLLFGVEGHAACGALVHNVLLNVQATVVSTGKKASSRIDLNKGAGRADVSAWKNAPEAKQYRALIRTSERLLEKEDLAPGTRERLDTLLYSLKEAILREDSARIRACEDDLNKLVRRVREEE